MSKDSIRQGHCPIPYQFEYINYLSKHKQPLSQVSLSQPDPSPIRFPEVVEQKGTPEELRKVRERHAVSQKRYSRLLRKRSEVSSTSQGNNNLFTTSNKVTHGEINLPSQNEERGSRMLPAKIRQKLPLDQNDRGPSPNQTFVKRATSELDISKLDLEDSTTCGEPNTCDEPSTYGVDQFNRCDPRSVGVTSAASLSYSLSQADNSILSRVSGRIPSSQLSRWPSSFGRRPNLEKTLSVASPFHPERSNLFSNSGTPGFFSHSSISTSCDFKNVTSKSDDVMSMRQKEHIAGVAKRFSARDFADLKDGRSTKLLEIDQTDGSTPLRNQRRFHSRRLLPSESRGTESDSKVRAAPSPAWIRLEDRFSLLKPTRGRETLLIPNEGAAGFRELPHETGILAHGRIDGGGKLQISNLWWKEDYLVAAFEKVLMSLEIS